MFTNPRFAIFRPLFVMALLATCANSFGQAPPAAVPGNILVRISDTDKAGVSRIVDAESLPASVAKALRDHGTTVDHALFPAAGPAGKALGAGDAPNVFLLKVSDTTTTAKVIDALKALPEVVYAEPDYLYTLDFIPNDPEFSRQWHLQNTGQYRLAGADVAAPAAWDINQGSASPVIAIIDTGADLTHPDLVNQFWSNPKEQAGDANGDGRPGFANFDDDGDGLVDEDSAGRQPGAPGYTNDLRNDDDENGFVDDIAGWDWVNNDAVPNDEQGHGTHCAGIAAAQTNNGIGIAGACPMGRIMPLKVFQVDGTAATSAISAAVVYASRNGAKVISMSFSGPSSTALSDALAVAYSTSIMVAASGNGGEADGARYPAGYSTVLGVGASDVVLDETTGQFREVVADFTNTTSAEVCAPGVNIRSTVPGGGYASWSGTSMATPLVAGIAAMMVSERTGGFWGPDQYYSQLIESRGTFISKTVLVVKNGIAVPEVVTLPRISALETLTMEPYPKLSVSSVAVSDPAGDQDNAPDAGEVIAVTVTLRNKFGNGENVNCTLTTADPFLTITAGAASFGNIGPNGVEDNTDNPFGVSVAANAPHNRKCKLTLSVSASNTLVVQTLDFFITIQHGTTISGLLSQDTVLRSGAEYLVPSALIVASGKKLTIEPGTLLRFYPGAGLVVDGTLVAVGTATNPIILMANNSSQGWNGVSFTDTSQDAILQNGSYISGCTMQFCEVSGVLKTSSLAVEGTISASSSTPFISKNLIYNNTGYQDGGISFLLGGPHRITQNIFLGNSASQCAGIHIRGATATIADNLIMNNASTTQSLTAGGLLTATSVAVSGNVIINNSGINGGLLRDYTGSGGASATGNLVIPHPSNRFVAVNSNSANMSIANNYWGPGLTAELERVGATSDVSMFHDKFNDAASGLFTYSPWLTSAPSIPQAPPYVVSVAVPSVVGAGEFEVLVTVNRDMNTSHPLTVSFGPADPYTQRIISGDWIGARQWRGKYRASLFTGDGIQHLRVAGGRDREFGRAMIADWRHTFEIDAAGLSGVGLQASGEAGRVDLFFQPVDEPDVAGYNVYRATTAGGTYTKLNSAVVYETRFSDFTAPQGLTRYYKVAAVRTDFTQSPLSDPASAAALDGTAPVVQHTPLASPIVLPVPGVSVQATVTDNIGVTSVQLFWKTSTEDSFTTVTMLHPSGNLYSYNIPASELAPPKLQYYIAAKDALGNTGTFASAAAPREVLVRTATNEPPTQPTIRPVLHVDITTLATDPEQGPVRYRYQWALDSTIVATHGPTTATEDTLREGGAITFTNGQIWTVTVTPIDIEDSEGPAATGTFRIGPNGQVRFGGWAIQ
ncbi:S8 family serine peptidase [bacterium]|nr:S8 family serine peptidase [bacterium]